MIRYDMAAAIATITLDRPDRMNAFTRQMAIDLTAAIDRADRDPDVRVIVLTGAGRMFCAGADLGSGGSAFDAPAADAGVVRRDFGGFVTLRLFDCLKPVIVAFNGSAAGIGVTMTLAADFRLAAKGAKFALPFVRRAIVPESASSWFLPRIVGIAKALDWALSGRSFSAEEALAAGLVRSLHDPAEIGEAAHTLAQELAQQVSPVSAALTRQLMWRMMSADHPMEAHRLESRGLAARAGTDDVREGVASFLEKRVPDFSGKVPGDVPDFLPWWDEPAFE